MLIPKLKFIVASLDEVFPIIHKFLNPSREDWDWSERIYWHYPQLRKRVSSVNNPELKKREEYSFFQELFEREKPLLEENSRIFQREWGKINDKVMLALSDIVEQEWPNKYATITARVSINPICPRDINRGVFDVFYKESINSMKEVVIHELLHFIYFEKWINVFPETDRREFEYPHLVWHLSEMVPGIILNDERIQRIFRHEFHSYEEYESIMIKDKPLLRHLQEFYDHRRSFEDFLRNSWNFIQTYREEIFSGI